MKDSGWNFQRNIPMGISFHKSGEVDCSSCVKISLRKSARLNIRNDDKYCFLWSILAKLHPCENISDRGTIYRQYFDELNIGGFDFSSGYKCSDMQRFE